MLAALSTVVFTGWRRIGWICISLILLLAYIKSACARENGLILNDNLNFSKSDYPIQCFLLLLLPIQVLLSRYADNTLNWLRCALALSAVMQAATIHIQFAINLVTDGAAGRFFDTNLIAARDGSQIYENATRLVGLTFNPNLAGAIILAGWPALLYVKPGYNVSKLIVSFAIIGCVTAIVLTYSRGAYLGILLQCIALTIIMLKSNFKQFAVAPCLLVIIAFVAGLTVYDEAIARTASITDITDRSLLHRLKVITIATQLIAERPLSGWGPSFFHSLYTSFYRIPGIAFSYSNVHSSLFNMILEVGLGGFALIVVVTLGGYLFDRRFVDINYEFISLVGLIVPFVSENAGANLSFAFPIVWLLGLYCIRADTNLQKWSVQYKRNAWISSFVLLLFFMWFLFYLKPFQPLHDRFQREVKKQISLPFVQSEVYIINFANGRQWHVSTFKSNEGNNTCNRGQFRCLPTLNKVMRLDSDIVTVPDDLGAVLNCVHTSFCTSNTAIKKNVKWGLARHLQSIDELEDFVCLRSGYRLEVLVSHAGSPWAVIVCSSGNFDRSHSVDWDYYRALGNLGWLTKLYVSATNLSRPLRGVIR